MEPLDRLDEEDEKQRCGINGPVVRRMRHLSQPGQLSTPDLVEDLARLLLPIWIDLSALVGGEKAQRTLGYGGVVHERLQGSDDGIATERHRVPGNTGVGNGTIWGLLEQAPDIVATDAENFSVDQLVVSLKLARLIVPGAIRGGQPFELAIEIAGKTGGAPADARLDAHHDGVEVLGF